jgi:hypothetical protein
MPVPPGKLPPRINVEMKSKENRIDVGDLLFITKLLKTA